MASLKSYFTTDTEFGELVDRDPTANVTGFVVSTKGPEPAGKDNKPLFKIILSNGNKKIPILFWGNKIIKKFRKEIVAYKVLSINGGLCLTVTESDYRKNNGIVPYDILVKENTEVVVLGDYEEQDEKKDPAKLVTFDELLSVSGLIQIHGHIRSKFALMIDNSTKETYGLGAICDETTLRKVTVHIEQFEKLDLDFGEPVVITGVVKQKDSMLTVYCDTTKNITRNSKGKKLSPEILLRCNRPLKRTRAE